MKVTSPTRRSMRRHLVAAIVVVLVLVIGVGGWAATAVISGAVVASGSIVVDSNVKKVQHLTGGIVGELRVRDGDRVRAGDIVVRLDETVTRANLAIVTKGLDELTARKARLESERDGSDTIIFPAQLLAGAGDPDRAAAMDSERKLFNLRRTARNGQKAQLRVRIAQLGEEIAGLTAQQNSKAKEIALIERELRQKMVENNVDLLCSLPEGRPSKTPTIEQILRLFENQNKHALYEGDRLIRQFADPLTPVQSQILQLLSIPTAVYGPGK